MQTRHLELNPWHKRQATLLHHFASLHYLKGLLEQIDQLIGFADHILEDRAELDVAGRALANWQTVDTAGHFSTHAFPALVDFREKVIRDIAARSYDRFSEAGERQCSRMLQEYAHQMIWATGEQENSLKIYTEEVFKYAGNISRMMRRPTRKKIELAPSAAARESFEGRPCRWYYVEIVKDAYEDHDGSYAGVTAARLRETESAGRILTDQT